MKKLVFTMAAVVSLSLATQAQNELQKKEAKPAKTAVNADGTAPAQTNPSTKKGSAVATEAAPEQEVTKEKTKTVTPKKSDETKKSGTRMAINEKGLPGEKKPKKNQTNNPK